jgi:hypothetical protein
MPASVTRVAWSLASVGVADSDDDAIRVQKAALTLATSIITGLAP